MDLKLRPRFDELDYRYWRIIGFICDLTEKKAWYEINLAPG